LTFWPQHLAGYAIDRQDNREIITGDGPQVIEAPARPAGGIHGTVVRADGRPATSAYVTAFATQLPPGVTDHQKINPDSSSASSSFLLTLPLGGRYRVLAREQTDTHNVWTVSDEIALDESRPIAEVRLTLPTGRNLPIRVLDPDGRPVADQPVHLELGFSLENGYSFSTILERRTGTASRSSRTWPTISHCRRSASRCTSACRRFDSRDVRSRSAGVDRWKSGSVAA
jgi:hypothetical protein